MILLVILLLGKKVDNDSTQNEAEQRNTLASSRFLSKELLKLS